MALVSVFFFSFLLWWTSFFLNNHMEKCNFTSQEYCMVSGVQKTVCMYFFHSKSERFVFFFLGKIEIIFQFPKNLFIYGGNRARAPVTKKGFTSHSHLLLFQGFSRSSSAKIGSFVKPESKKN